MTLQEAYDIIYSLNEEAHTLAWSHWMAAEEEEDEELREELLEEASHSQSNYFREHYYEYDKETQDEIRYWVYEDVDFYDEMRDFFGHEEFAYEFFREDL